MFTHINQKIDINFILVSRKRAKNNLDLQTKIKKNDP